jgi:hypothetical protein
MKHIKLFEQFLNESNEKAVGNALYEKKYSDEERKDLEQKGMAMPGGRFPVKDATDLKNAIWLLPKAKGNVEDVIQFLAKRLKKLGATNYENMFNKTLATMGINKDISHYVSEGLINEAKAKGLDWAISQLGNKPNCYKVASFVYDNYDKITGLRKSMRNEEMDFPDEIIDIVDHYGLDIVEFTDCYSDVAG